MPAVCSDLSLTALHPVTHPLHHLLPVKECPLYPPLVLSLQMSGDAFIELQVINWKALSSCSASILCCITCRAVWHLHVVHSKEWNHSQVQLWQYRIQGWGTMRGNYQMFMQKPEGNMGVSME